MQVIACENVSSWPTLCEVAMEYGVVNIGVQNISEVSVVFLFIPTACGLRRMIVST